MSQDITNRQFPEQLLKLSRENPALAVNMYEAIRNFVANKYQIRNIVPEAHYLEMTGKEFDSRINWFRMRIYFDIDHPNKPLMFDENVPECYQKDLDKLTSNQPDKFVFPNGLEYLASVGEEIMPTRFQAPEIGHFFDAVPHKDDVQGLLDYLSLYKEKAEGFLTRAKQFQANPLIVVQFSPGEYDLLNQAAENLSGVQDLRDILQGY